MSVESAVAAAQAACTHTKIDGTTACISHKFLNGQLWVRCARCGEQWNSAPSSQVIVLAGDRKEYSNVCKAFGDNPNAPMKFFDGTGQTAGKHFTECVIVGSFFDREQWVEELQMARVRLTTNGNNAIKFYGCPGYYIAGWDMVGGPQVHDEKGNLVCARCKKRCNETYKGGFCGSCPNHFYGSKAMHHKKSKVVGGLMNKKSYEAFGFGGVTAQPTAEFATNRKQGDIWKLPKANAPFRSEQWAYQGSAKTPYVITRYEDKRDGAVTNEGWACSCMSFTRNVPRTPCKHILNVMLSEGLGMPIKKSTAKLANVDDKKMAEFEKWQREQAALKAGKQPVTGEAKLNLFGNTGRKFR